MKIGTLTTGSVTTEFNLPFLAAVLHIRMPAINLTAIRINSLGFGTVTDLNEDGILSVGLNNKVGAGAGDIVIPVAQGLIGQQNTVVSITNSGAQTPDVFVYSMRKDASFYIKSTTNKVYANTGVEITDFSFIGIPNMGETDELNITYRNGLTQKITREDLRSINSLMQQVNGNKYDYFISNMNQNISRVSFIPDADQNIYVQKYAKV